MGRTVIGPSIACLLACAAVGVEAQTVYPRVRGTDLKTQALIESAVRRSPTVRRLAEAIDRTDVIAYVQVSLATSTASLTFVRASDAVRYVRVSLNAARTPNELIGLLGHELQHVLEIAGDPSVRNEASLAEFYRRVGLSPVASRGFETKAAQQIGRLVRRELAAGGDAADAVAVARWARRPEQPR